MCYNGNRRDRALIGTGTGKLSGMGIVMRNKCGNKSRSRNEGTLLSRYGD